MRNLVFAMVITNLGLFGFGLVHGQSTEAPVLVDQPSIPAEEFTKTQSSKPEGFFDLFGRKIERPPAEEEGELPSGELKVVPSPKAPKLFSRIRKKSLIAKKSQSSRPRGIIRKLNWKRGSKLAVVNSGAASQQSTHLVRSGGRVFLRRFP